MLNMYKNGKLFKTVKTNKNDEFRIFMDGIKKILNDHNSVIRYEMSTVEFDCDTTNGNFYFYRSL